MCVCRCLRCVLGVAWGWAEGGRVARRPHTWHAPGSVYAVHVRPCVRAAALKLKAGGEQLGTRCKLRALKSPDKADEAWTIEKRRIDQIFAVTNHSHVCASHPIWCAYQLPTSPARSFRPARVSVPVLSSRAEKAETLAAGRGQWAARHFAPVSRMGNGLICEHRGQAERGWRFAPTVHIAARSSPADVPTLRSAYRPLQLRAVICVQPIVSPADQRASASPCGAFPRCSCSSRRRLCDSPLRPPSRASAWSSSLSLSLSRVAASLSPVCATRAHQSNVSPRIPLMSSRSRRQ